MKKILVVIAVLIGTAACAQKEPPEQIQCRAYKVEPYKENGRKIRKCAFIHSRTMQGDTVYLRYYWRGMKILPIEPGTWLTVIYTEKICDSTWRDARILINH